MNKLIKLMVLTIYASAIFLTGCFDGKTGGTMSVYAAGSCKNSSNVSVPVYWKNGTRVELTSIEPSKDASVTDIAVAIE